MFELDHQTLGKKKLTAKAKLESILMAATSPSETSGSAHLAGLELPCRPGLTQRSSAGLGLPRAGIKSVYYYWVCLILIVFCSSSLLSLYSHSKIKKP